MSMDGAGAPEASTQGVTLRIPIHMARHPTRSACARSPSPSGHAAAFRV
jgi:hypothetical protein